MQPRHATIQGMHLAKSVAEGQLMIESRRAPDAGVSRRSTVAERVGAALRASSCHDFPATSVLVEDADGRVRLVGWVPELSDRVRAGTIATEAAGSTPVDNELRVGPPARRRDDEIKSSVQAILTRTRSLAQTALDVTVHDGVVNLAGVIDTANHRRYAGALCWWIPGVRGVTNRPTPV